MGQGHGDHDDLEIDLLVVTGARALRRAGWTDAEIARACGHLPPMHMTLDEIVAHNERVRSHGGRGRHRRGMGPVDDGAFTGDP